MGLSIVCRQKYLQFEPNVNCFDYLYDATNDESKHEFFSIPQFNHDLFPHSQQPPTSILSLKHVDILQLCRKSKNTWEDMLSKEQPYFYEYFPWHFDQANLSHELESLCCYKAFMKGVNEVGKQTGMLRCQLEYWLRAESGAQNADDNLWLVESKNQIGSVYQSLGQFNVP